MQTQVETMGLGHVDRLNSVEKLEKEGFHGLDLSLVSSLLDSKLVWRETEDSFIFVYSIGAGRFDRCSFRKDINPKKEWDWINFEDLNDFYGEDIFEHGQTFPEIIAIFVSYYGTEEIFGTSYWEGFEIEGLEKNPYSKLSNFNNA